MELREFITATLLDIQGGVHDAIKAATKASLTGAINPVWGGVNDAGREQIQNVQFDIAVTIQEKVAGQAGAGIKVVGLTVGGGGSTSTESSNVSRIQFSVPVIPPVTTISPA